MYKILHMIFVRGMSLYNRYKRNFCRVKSTFTIIKKVFRDI